MSVEREDHDGRALLHVDDLILVVVVGECPANVGAMARRHRDVLLAADRVRDDPSVVGGAIVEPPQQVARLRVEGLDAKSGDLLWRFNNGSAHNGGIVSYAVGGKQYIAVATGHGSYVGRALADHYHKDKIINMKESAAIVVFSLD